MKKFRIVKETNETGDVWYLIERRLFLFIWENLSATRDEQDARRRLAAAKANPATRKVIA